MFRRKLKARATFRMTGFLTPRHHRELEMYWIFGAATVFLLFLFLLNRWNYRERAKLTPAQRKEEDEELKREGVIY